jgi:hypothetical protein
MRTRETTARITNGIHKQNKLDIRTVRGWLHLDIGRVIAVDAALSDRSRLARSSRNSCHRLVINYATRHGSDDAVAAKEIWDRSLECGPVAKA